MKKWHRIILIFVGIAGVSCAVGWSYYNYHYPYGQTHRCSKVLAMCLWAYADEHDGKFPSSTHPDACGLSSLIDEDPSVFEMVVGKAGDLELAKEYYRANGYLRPQHTSWHYVEGLTIEDRDRAILWDKIPLGHNGQRTKKDTREVITTFGLVMVIPATEWVDFIDSQRGLTQKDN